MLGSDSLLQKFWVFFVGDSSCPRLLHNPLGWCCLQFGLCFLSHCKLDSELRSMYLVSHLITFCWSEFHLLITRNCWWIKELTGEREQQYLGLFEICPGTGGSFSRGLQCFRWSLRTFLRQIVECLGGLEIPSTPYFGMQWDNRYTTALHALLLRVNKKLNLGILAYSIKICSGIQKFSL